MLARLAELARSLKPGHFRLFLALAELTENDPHHSVTVAARDLCKLALIALSVFPEALKALVAPTATRPANSSPSQPRPTRSP